MAGMASANHIFRRAKVIANEKILKINYSQRSIKNQVEKSRPLGL
jgi:hypothetical protein